MKRTLANLPDALALLGLAITFASIAACWSSLPAIMPIHFGLSGEVNGYGPRGFLFFPAAVSIFVLGLFYVVRRFPHLYNLPVPPGDPRRAQQERLASRLVAWLGMVLSWNFLYLTTVMIRSAHTHAQRLALWTLPLTIIVVLIPIVWFFVQLRKQARLG